MLYGPNEAKSSFSPTREKLLLLFTTTLQRKQQNRCVSKERRCCTSSGKTTLNLCTAYLPNTLTTDPCTRRNKKTKTTQMATCNRLLRMSKHFPEVCPFLKGNIFYDLNKRQVRRLARAAAAQSRRHVEVQHKLTDHTQLVTVCICTVSLDLFIYLLCTSVQFNFNIKCHRTLCCPGCRGVGGC